MADVRSRYAGATIFCVGGPFLGDTATQYIESAIQAANDPKVKLLSFPSPDPADGWGCDYHPSQATHEKLGQVLTSALQQELGW